MRQALENGEIIHREMEKRYENISAKDAAKLSVDILLSEEFLNQHIMITGLERMKQKDLLKMIQEMSSSRVSIKLSENTIQDIMKLHLIHSILELPEN